MGCFQMAGSEQMVNMRTPYHTAVKENRLPKQSAKHIVRRWNEYIRYCPMKEVKHGKFLRDELNGLFYDLYAVMHNEWGDL